MACLDLRDFEVTSPAAAGFEDGFIAVFGLVGVFGASSFGAGNLGFTALAVFAKAAASGSGPGIIGFGLEEVPDFSAGLDTGNSLLVDVAVVILVVDVW